MSAILVVAWNTELKEPLGVRLALNLRCARSIAAELEQEFPWSPRISFFREVDFWATIEGMSTNELVEVEQRMGQKAEKKRRRFHRER
jgi:hypothetical protein